MSGAMRFDEDETFCDEGGPHILEYEVCFFCGDPSYICAVCEENLSADPCDCE